MEIKTGGDPTLRRNQIHDGKQPASCPQHGLGTLEDNDITRNALAGVEIKTGGDPALRATGSTVVVMRRCGSMMAATGP